MTRLHNVKKNAAMESKNLANILMGELMKWILC
jgi:hypothetical protein